MSDFWCSSLHFPTSLLNCRCADSISIALLLRRSALAKLPLATSFGTELDELSRRGYGSSPMRPIKVDLEVPSDVEATMTGHTQKH